MAVPDLPASARALHNNLNAFKATDHPGAPIADMFDAILAMAQEQFPADPIIQAVKPTVRDVTGGVRESAGDLRATLDQILNALGEGGPSIG
jgi:hypothetical protein